MVNSQIDKDTLRLVYNRLSIEIIEFAKLLWENIKFFATLLSALVTLDIYLSNFAMKFIEYGTSISILMALLSMFMPFLILILSFIGHAELKRRWARLIETLASRAKVEALLRIHTDLSVEFKKLGIFPKDRYIHQRFSEIFKKYESSDDFVMAELSPKKGRKILRGKNFYLMMSRIYLIFKIIGVVLLVLKSIIIVTILLMP